MPIQVDQSIPCPCCKQAVRFPTLDIVIDHYGIQPLQARILRAVWRGKGQTVETARIFDAMYIDNSGHRPNPDYMYLAFKVALFRLREKLAGSGIAIVNGGYGRGYKLVMRRPSD